MSTIFSKIIAKEIFADIVYEDDSVIAFLDINPLQPGHTLVVPKTPSEHGLAADPQDLAHVIAIGQKIGQVLTNTIRCDGVNFLMNNGEAAGQKVFHTHLHVIPRFKNDGVYQEPIHGNYENGEASALAQMLREAMNH